MTKCHETNIDAHVSLLQIRSTPISPGLLILAILLFNRMSRGILPIFSRPPIVCDNDETNYTALENRQPHVSKDVGINNILSLLPAGSPVAVL